MRNKHIPLPPPFGAPRPPPQDGIGAEFTGAQTGERGGRPHRLADEQERFHPRFQRRVPAISDSLHCFKGRASHEGVGAAVTWRRLCQLRCPLGLSPFWADLEQSRALHTRPARWISGDGKEPHLHPTDARKHTAAGTEARLTTTTLTHCAEPAMVCSGSPTHGPKADTPGACQQTRNYPPAGRYSAVEPTESRKHAAPPGTWTSRESTTLSERRQTLCVSPLVTAEPSAEGPFAGLREGGGGGGETPT